MNFRTFLESASTVSELIAAYFANPKNPIYALHDFLEEAGSPLARIIRMLQGQEPVDADFAHKAATHLSVGDETNGVTFNMGADTTLQHPRFVMIYWGRFSAGQQLTLGGFPVNIRRTSYLFHEPVLRTPLVRRYIINSWGSGEPVVLGDLEASGYLKRSGNVELGQYEGDTAVTTKPLLRRISGNWAIDQAIDPKEVGEGLLMSAFAHLVFHDLYQRMVDDTLAGN